MTISDHHSLQTLRRAAAMLQELTIDQVQSVIMAAKSVTSSPLGLVWGADNYDLYRRPDPCRQAVEALSRAAQEELCALYYIGRGDFGGSFDDALQHCSKLNDNVLARTIFGKRPSLPHCLSAGLGLLTESQS
jgi:hypothetical protein